MVVRAAAAARGAFADADDGRGGNPGNNGNAGTDGKDGNNGAAGHGGSNSASGLTISGGGGGGAGGAGAGGQGGGGGASGTGGGGGGGGGGNNVFSGEPGGAVAQAVRVRTAARAVPAARVARAVPVAVRWKSSPWAASACPHGSSFQAKGGVWCCRGDGTSGAAVDRPVSAAAAADRRASSTAATGAGEGGNGARGGQGGIGGGGGDGGDGGQGGGGAGGTIKLYASDIDANGVTINTSGGTGGMVGSNGRLIIGGNTSLALGAGQTVTSVGGAPSGGNVTGAMTSYTSGEQSTNAMISGSVMTPYIADWQFANGQTVQVDGGAAIYGLLDGLTAAKLHDDHRGDAAQRRDGGGDRPRYRTRHRGGGLHRLRHATVTST